MAFPRHIISNKKGRKRDETCDYVLRFFNFAMGIEKFERFKPDSTLHIY